MSENVQWSLRVSARLIDYLRSSICSDLQVLCGSGDPVPAHKLVLSLASVDLEKQLAGLEYGAQVGSTPPHVGE